MIVDKIQMLRPYVVFKANSQTRSKNRQSYGLNPQILLSTNLSTEGKLTFGIQLCINIKDFFINVSEIIHSKIKIFLNI